MEFYIKKTTRDDYRLLRTNYNIFSVHNDDGDLIGGIGYNWDERNPYYGKMEMNLIAKRRKSYNNREWHVLKNNGQYVEKKDIDAEIDTKGVYVYKTDLQRIDRNSPYSIAPARSFAQTLTLKPLEMDNDKILVVDLYRGGYTKNFIGHELFNFEKNLDGFYYGYIPPDSNVNVSNIESTAKDKVEGVLVVYVKAISDTDNNREIIGYCENSTVYAKPQPNTNLNRQYRDKDGKIKNAEWSVKSDNLTDLRNNEPKFIIKIKDFNSYMFRYQRSTLAEYPELKVDIIDYLRNGKIIDKDDGVEQENIQREYPASDEFAKAYGSEKDEEIDTKYGKAIKKNAAIAKKVLVDSNYKCKCNDSHITFNTPRGVPYMEGHHLIPCTPTNSKLVFNKYKSKLDRIENIVCVCANCHRAIHFGDIGTKKAVLIQLYNKQKDILAMAGITIALDDLLAFYIG